MKRSEIVLFDTNILVYAHNKDTPLYGNAKSIRDAVLSGKIKAVLAQQNLFEFYAVITDKKRVEKPLEPRKALKEVEKYLKSSFYIIHPQGETPFVAVSLIKNMNLKGAEVFDAYLVATMITNGVSVIFTDNERDFKIYKGIKVINPFKKVKKTS